MGRAPAADRLRVAALAALLAVLTALGAWAASGPGAALGGPAGARAAAAAAGFPTVLHATPRDAFVDPSGRAVVLRGFNMIPVHRHSTGTWVAQRYVRIADAGFNAVRFVLYWDVMEPARGRFSAPALADLDTAIARARAAGLYVVLDMVHLWGPRGFADVPRWARRGDSLASVRAGAAGYLSRLAARYRDEPAVAAYDPVNEFHHTPLDQDAVLRVYDRLIAVLRAADPRKVILVEPSYGDTSVAPGLADLTVLRHRRNVVWSFHDYFAGGDRTGYDGSGGQQGRYTYDGVTGYSRADAGRLAAHLGIQLAAARSAGLPVWIGEFGIGANAPGHDAWVRAQVSLFRRNRLGYAWWEYYTDGPLSATRPDGSFKPLVGLLH